MESISNAMHHFLLVYSHDEGRLIEEDEFTDSDLATAAYTAAEHRYKGRSRFEIVLVGSDSIQTIMKTHGHYFAGDDMAPFSESLHA